MRLTHLAIFACILATPTLAQPPEQAWKPIHGHLMTRWAKDVAPGAALPDYPRPIMIRDEWMSLNGLWEYKVIGEDQDKPVSGRILVPFPIESALSGVKRALSPEETLHYSRTFAPPPDWAKKGRVLLHFGAVNWKSTVTLNGKKLGDHSGGYDPFSFDITDALKEGNNEITVDVSNPVNTGGQPRGKQWLKPHGIWYTPSSGIWQTVWIEPAPRKSIAGLSIRADRTDGKVSIDITDSLSEADNFLVYEAEVFHDGKSIVLARSPLPGVALAVPNPHAWSPDDPFLYDVVVRTYLANKLVDQVKSYFAFRDIKVAKDEKGINRLMLNGKPLFQYGPLDQGFWPDGLYTAPTDAALKSDIEAVKKMGGNMLRKHVKVEPERFYYWCDKLGIMVWQDMPSAFFAAPNFDEGFPQLSDDWKANFERELHAMITARSSHPSIVVWVPFNEGWGQNDLAWCRTMAEKVKQWDPSRLVNNASGWTDMKVGDLRDIHEYPDPACPQLEPTRAAVLGEFGGLGLPLDGHTWVSKDNWGYRSYKDQKEVTAAYVDLMEQLPPLIGQGLCAAVYTQTTDVEIECNGWMTYDREVWKIDPDKAREATRQLFQPAPTFVTVVPHAPEAKKPLRYTTADPGDDWFNPAIPLNGGSKGPPGFGTAGTPGAIIGTPWKTSDIWLRQEFELKDVPARPYLNIHHDEDAEVYINGKLVAELKGYTTNYRRIRLSKEAAALLRPGTNNLSIHCHQTTGGQYIDCGLDDLVPAK